MKKTVALERKMYICFRKIDDTSYFYLYRISYMWYAPLGFLITVIVGLIVSNIVRCTFKRTRKELDPNLFFPIIGKRLRNKRSLRFEDREFIDSHNKVQGKYTFNIDVSSDDII